MSVANLFDAPNYLSKATTATGSVAEMIEPNNRHDSHVKSPEYPSMYFIVIPLRNVEPSTIGPAIKSIYQNYILMICQSELKADSNIKAGKKMKRISCGDRKLHCLIALPSTPKSYQ